jgi:3-isopropylmalate dehydrogenase
MQLIVLPGDGIGPEITAATVEVLDSCSRRFGLALDMHHDLIGLASLQRDGMTVRPDLVERVKAADGLVLGPLSTFELSDDAATGQVNPSKFFRKTLDLYANIRPARTYPELPQKVGAFDLVVVRENTEGFYADRNIESGGSEMLITPDVVVSLRRITRLCCERVARSAFELARSRRRQLTIVHKANVLRLGDGMFIESCHKVGRDYPEVRIDAVIVDAMMAHVVRAPQRFDVIVTTNMFGDILSDLTAELSGSLGLGGSINAGDRYAMAQAAHGSAPDIAGRDCANPFALILSAAQLLGWHGQRRQLPAFGAAAQAIEQGVAEAIRDGETTPDIGGLLGTAAVGRALAQRLQRAG